MASQADTSYEAVKAQLEQARLAFGQNLSRWRRLNRWAQDTPELWANTAGFVVLHNSQLSKLERGLSAQPGPIIFRALGVLNQRVAEEDWGKGIPSALADKLRDAKPVKDSDGYVWDGADFYASFIGQKDWPDMPKPDRRMSDAEAQAWSLQFRNWFEAIRTEAEQTPLAGLVSLMECVPEEHQASMQAVVTGAQSYSPAQLMRMTDNSGLGPELWIQEWRMRLGQTGALNLDDHWRLVAREPEPV